MSAPTSIVVDRYELGPIGTNCYVVRESPAAAEAVVIDPGGNAIELERELARFGAACVAILITHGHWDHLGGVADLAEATDAPVHMAAESNRGAFSISRAEGKSGRRPFRPWLAKVPELSRLGHTRPREGAIACRPPPGVGAVGRRPPAETVAHFESRAARSERPR